MEVKLLVKPDIELGMSLHIVHQGNLVIAPKTSSGNQSIKGHSWRRGGLPLGL